MVHLHNYFSPSPSAICGFQKKNSHLFGINKTTFQYFDKQNQKIKAIYLTKNKTKYNKTSIQWTPGSQVYLSKKKKLFGQK